MEKEARDPKTWASGIGSEDVELIMGTEKIYALSTEQQLKVNLFIMARYKHGAMWIKDVGSMFITFTWVGTDVNCIIECGQLTVMELVTLVDKIDVYMFPSKRTSKSKDIEDIKRIIGKKDTEIDNILAFYSAWENKMVMPKEHIRIADHRGTWYVIDTTVTLKHGKIYLLEHETYGDDTPCLIIDDELNVLVEDVSNGFDDYNEKYMD